MSQHAARMEDGGVYHHNSPSWPWEKSMRCQQQQPIEPLIWRASATVVSVQV